MPVDNIHVRRDFQKTFTKFSPFFNRYKVEQAKFTFSLETVSKNRMELKESKG